MASNLQITYSMGRLIRFATLHAIAFAVGACGDDDPPVPPVTVVAEFSPGQATEFPQESPVTLREARDGNFSPEFGISFVFRAGLQDDFRENENTLVEKRTQDNATVPFSCVYHNARSSNSGQVECRTIARDGTLVSLLHQIPLNDNRFHHVTYTRRDNQFRLVVDGVETEELASIGTPDNNGPVAVGIRYPDLTNVFFGQIGSLSIGTSYLTAVDIAQRRQKDMAIIQGTYMLDPATDFSSSDPNLAVFADEDTPRVSDGDFTLSIPMTAPTDQTDLAGPENSLVEKWSGSRLQYPFSCRIHNSTAASPEGQVVCQQYDQVATSAVTTTTALNDGTPHHVVFVKDGGVLYLYVDDVLESSTLAQVSDLDNRHPVYIGHRAGSLLFEGTLGPIILWPRALTQSEIRWAGQAIR